MKWAIIILFLLSVGGLYSFYQDQTKIPHSFISHVQYENFAVELTDKCLNDSAISQFPKGETRERFCTYFSGAAALSKAIQDHPDEFKKYMTE